MDFKDLRSTLAKIIQETLWPDYKANALADLCGDYLFSAQQFEWLRGRWTISFQDLDYSMVMAGLGVLPKASVSSLGSVEFSWKDFQRNNPDLSAIGYSTICCNPSQPRIRISFFRDEVNVGEMLHVFPFENLIHDSWMPLDEASRARVLERQSVLVGPGRGLAFVWVARGECDRHPEALDVWPLHGLMSFDSPHGSPGDPLGLLTGGEKEFLQVYGSETDGDFTANNLVVQTLTRDMFYRNLTVLSGATIITNGYRIFVSQLLRLEGTIRTN
jgi:hypothetical protein